MPCSLPPSPRQLLTPSRECCDIMSHFLSRPDARAGMTEVLARARELVKQSAIPRVNLDEISAAASSISQAVAHGYQAQRDADPATDTILAHYHNIDHRHESFRQHGGWHLERPSAHDLAEAGFFYAPLKGCEDRVACYSCGKVLPKLRRVRRADPTITHARLHT